MTTPELFWIPGPWSGRLAVATRPRGGDWLEDEAMGIRSAGVDVLVSLLEDEEAADLALTDEGTAFEREGLEFVSFPIPDRGVPQSVVAGLGLLETIVGLLEHGKNVAIHCRQSVGRSGLVASGALIVSGSGAEEAIRVVSTARGQPVPETSEQIRWLRNLPSETFVAR